MSEEFHEEDFPSIDDAYKLAMEFYAFAIQRADALDARIQSVMSFSSAVTFALPLAIHNLSLDINSNWTLVLAALILIELGVYLAGRFFVGWGKLEVLSPLKIYNQHLRKAPAEFKKDMIYYAGQSWDENNRKILTPRWRLTVTLSLVLATKVLLFFAWVFYHFSSPLSAGEPAEVAVVGLSLLFS